MDAHFPLPGYAFVALPGPDAAKFLQGLVTCDVHRVGPGRSTLGAFCQVNGRVSALFRLVERGGVLHLRVRGEQLPALLERLARAVFRAQVRPAEASPGLAALGIAGPHAVDLLARHLDAAPTEPDAAADAAPWTIVRVPGDPPRFEVYGPPSELARLGDRLAAAGVARGSEPAWSLLEIRAGIPELDPATVDAFLPQNLDLERLGGLSFGKGCYPGQEVVARTQHLGEIKRRLVHARAPGEVPAAGTRIRALDGGRERDAGTVVRAAPAADGVVEMLAVVPVAEFGSTLRLGGPAGAPLSLRA